MVADVALHVRHFSSRVKEKVKRNMWHNYALEWDTHARKRGQKYETTAVPWSTCPKNIGSLRS